MVLIKVKVQLKNEALRNEFKNNHFRNVAVVKFGVVMPKK